MKLILSIGHSMQTGANKNGHEERQFVMDLLLPAGSILQKIFDGVITQEITETADRPENRNVNTDASQWSTDNKDYAWYFIIVTVIAAIIMWSVGVMFWKTAFLFVGRVVGFYVAMIFSPLAFFSRGNIPLVSKLPQVGLS